MYIPHGLILFLWSYTSAPVTSFKEKKKKKKTYHRHHHLQSQTTIVLIYFRRYFPSYIAQRKPRNLLFFLEGYVFMKC